MPRENLTVKRLDSLKPTTKRFEIMDAIVPGMGIRVTEKGQKTFILVTRYPGKTTSARRALGEYGAITLDEARERAREWLGLIKRGVDPRDHEEARRQANLAASAEKKETAFEHVLDRFLAARRRDGVRKVDEDERDFRRECVPTTYEPNKDVKGVKPVWEGRAVADITMSDIMRVLEGIADRGKQRQALNIGQKIGTFFNWCVDDDLIEVSPYRAKKVRAKIGKKESRRRVLSDAELRAFWRATERLGPIYQQVYRLLLLTGQRLNDIAQADRSELDRAARAIIIPAARYKSDRNHFVPLSADALDVANELPVWTGKGPLCSLDGRHSITIGNKIKQRLDAAMLAELQKEDPEAVLPAWVNHDLRRTVRTRLSALRVSFDVAEAVIGHAKTGLGKVYDHYELADEKRDALERWAAALRAVVDPEQSDNVVTIAGRARA